MLLFNLPLGPHPITCIGTSIYGVRDSSSIKGGCWERDGEDRKDHLTDIPTEARQKSLGDISSISHALWLKGNDWIAIVPQHSTSPSFLQLWPPNVHNSLVPTSRCIISTFNQHFG